MVNKKCRVGWRDVLRDFVVASDYVLIMCDSLSYVKVRFELYGSDCEDRSIGTRSPDYTASLVRRQQFACYSKSAE